MLRKRLILITTSICLIYATHNQADTKDLDQQEIVKKAMTEDEFYSSLSDMSKIDYDNLEPEGKKIALDLSNNHNYKSKDVAVKMAIELGWSKESLFSSTQPHTTGQDSSKFVSKNDKSTTDQDKIVVRKIRHIYVDHLHPVDGKSIDPNTLIIIADDGIVTLKGTVPTTSQKNVLISWSKLIKGVKSINDELIIN